MAALEPRQADRSVRRRPARPVPSTLAPWVGRQAFDDSVVVARITEVAPSPEQAREALEAAGIRLALWVPTEHPRCPRATWEYEAWIDDPEAVAQRTPAGEVVPAGDQHHVWLEGPGADLRSAELVELPPGVGEDFGASAVIGVLGSGGARGRSFYERQLRLLRALVPGGELLDLTAGRVPPDEVGALADAFGVHVAQGRERAWIYTLGLRVFGLPELECFVGLDAIEAGTADLRALAERWHREGVPGPGEPVTLGDRTLMWLPWDRVGKSLGRGLGTRKEDRERLEGASVVVLGFAEDLIPEEEAPKAAGVPAWAAGLASLVVPGAGQLLNGDVLKGVLVFTFAVVTLALCGLVNVLAAWEAWRRASAEPV